MVNSAAYSSRYDDDPGVGLGVGPGVGETVLKWISTAHFFEQNIHIPKVSPSQNCEVIISERVHNVRSRDFIRVRATYGYGNCISRMRKELSSLYYPWRMVCYP